MHYFIQCLLHIFLPNPTNMIQNQQNYMQPLQDNILHKHTHQLQLQKQHRSVSGPCLPLASRFIQLTTLLKQVGIQCTFFFLESKQLDTHEFYLLKSYSFNNRTKTLVLWKSHGIARHYFFFLMLLNLVCKLLCKVNIIQFRSGQFFELKNKLEWVSYEDIHSYETGKTSGAKNTDQILEVPFISW